MTNIDMAMHRFFPKLNYRPARLHKAYRKPHKELENYYLHINSGGCDFCSNDVACLDTEYAFIYGLNT
jgi:hypothetical protein